jgi:hypothetical protein
MVAPVVAFPQAPSDSMNQEGSLTLSESNNNFYQMIHYKLREVKFFGRFPNFSFKKKSLTCLPSAQAGQKKHWGISGRYGNLLQISPSRARWTIFASCLKGWQTGM